MRIVYSIKPYSVKCWLYLPSQATLKGTRLLSLGLKPQGFTARFDKPGQGAMPDILELTPQHVAWLHRQVGMLALQGLHASQFIHADAALSLLGPLRGMG